MMTYRGKVYKVMMYFFNEYRDRGTVLRMFHEGSSRSGKTFDVFDFLYDICVNNERSYNIYVFRNTLQNCKEYTLADFKKKLSLRGVFNPEALTGENVRPDYRVGNSTIHFRGLDKMAEREGYDCDIVYINEMLDDITKAQYENVTMRCTTMIIGDWNPKCTEHWAFLMEGQPDTIFTHTTYKDNQFCPAAVAKKIESYEPTTENIEAGTANEWRWKVYGLGIRAAQEGLIYPNIDWIDDFPNDCEHEAFGIDFGFTEDPMAIARVGVKGRDLYIKEEFYAPVSEPDTACDIVASILGERGYAIADCADKYAKNPEGMVQSMNMRGLSVIKAKKGPDSIVNGIYQVQNFRLHCVRSKNMQVEANSYIWDSVNGIPIPKPKDQFNHLWDAVRYVVYTVFYGNIAS